MFSEYLCINNEVPLSNGFHEASLSCKPTSLGTGAGRRCRADRSAPTSPTKTGNLLPSSLFCRATASRWFCPPRRVRLLYSCSSWVAVKHPHVQGQPQQMQENHALSLMLLKSNELVVVDSAKQELMRSEVEHSWIFLFHLLVFLLCLHQPCLSCLSFLVLFLSSANIHIHPSITDLHRPNSLHSMSHPIHPLHSILLHILLHSPCESGLSFFLFLGLFLSLI